MADPTKGIFLTGATGFLGGEILARLLERRDAPVYVLVRAESEVAAELRLASLLESLLGTAEPWSDRVIAVRGDVTRTWLGMSSARRDWLAERVARIIHCAASVSFELGLEQSRAINVEGTRRVVELAELCARRGGLDWLVHVSTAYVAGDHDGTFTEADLDVGQGFRNPYERSKFEAEQLVRGRGSGLPWQIVRPSIVVGDSATGWTPAFNVLYGPMKAFARGAYPAIPARSGSPVDVVPVDYVAEATLALAGRPETTHHLTAGEAASSVGELVELGSAAARRPKPLVMPPWLYRAAVHPLLVRTGSERRRRALRRSQVYFPYFAMRTRYDNAGARQALAPQGVEAPALPTYFDRLLDYALEADWGKRGLPRHRVMGARTAEPGPVGAPIAA